ncbi:MAG: GAF domain-containing protein [Chloroflexi bacterium]|nr:MAG: GAF domain-containing protein [Chloroflexota bacterium]
MRSMLGSGLRLQLALFAGAGLAILAGASLNIQGYHGEQALIAVAAGILAWAGGVLSKRWKIAAGLAIGAIALTAVEVRFSGSFFWINLAGILLLGLGGVVGAIGYEKLTDALRRRVTELQSLNEELEEQHRMFLAATEDPGLTFKDMGALNTATSRQTGAGFCCYYLLGAEGRQFVPQLPAAGFEGRSPQLLIVRKEGGDPLLTPLEANQEYYAEDPDRLQHVARLFPIGFKVSNALVQPMLMNNRLGGFILLGNREGGFGPDDKRLVLTLAVRAAIHFGSQTAVSQTQEELARYTILNDIAKQASGLPFEEVMKLVIERARELVPYDACRVAIFGEDGTYTMLGGSPVASSIERGPLGEVKNGGKVVIRHLLTRSDGLFSGLDTGSETAQAAEALAPISGREGVFGALCLGRKGGIAFGDKDIPSLQELGAIAGVAVENSRILQRVSGQAFKVSSALDSLAEISEALTATTKGTATLEQKTLEVAARLAGGTHALLTRTESGGKNRIVNAVGFGREVVGLEIANGQGMVGAVMLSRQPLAVPDVHDSFDLANPPDLAAAMVRGGLCVPIIHQQALWGTLAVFTADRKQWAEADLRVIATLANQAVVALQNAELFDGSNRMVWELQNLMGGLTAVTSTLNLEEVLEKVLASAAKACEAQIGVLALDERGKLEVKAAFGSDPETARRLALELGGEICQDVFASGKSFMHYADKARSSGPLDPQAVLCVPLTLRGKPIGVLFLANYVAGKPFSEDHKRVVTELGAQASVAIDNARLFREREVVVLESLTAMAALVDAKDPYTAGHSKRVTAYALQIARQMNYAAGNQDAWTRLERGCLLHDLGKINVPDAVLAKPDRLTDEEFDQLKKHPVVGYEVLKNLHMLTDELVIVRSHHERFDGKGYPDRKGGGDLPIIAYIAAAADAFDAMTSDRPYRRGMSLELALAEIGKEAGQQFHPDVAEALLDSAGKGEFKIIPQESLFKEAPVVGAFENPTA